MVVDAKNTLSESTHVTFADIMQRFQQLTLSMSAQRITHYLQYTLEKVPGARRCLFDSELSLIGT